MGCIRPTASVRILRISHLHRLRQAVRHRAGYDGIVIFGDSCAIDIDNSVENGVLSNMAEDIIARMDTYTEYSPSGAGVRILCRSLPPGGCLWRRRMPMPKPMSTLVFDTQVNP